MDSLPHHDPLLLLIINIVDRLGGALVQWLTQSGWQNSGFGSSLGLFPRNWHVLPTACVSCSPGLLVSSRSWKTCQFNWLNTLKRAWVNECWVRVLLWPSQGVFNSRLISGVQNMNGWLSSDSVWIIFNINVKSLTIIPNTLYFHMVVNNKQLLLEHCHVYHSLSFWSVFSWSQAVVCMVDTQGPGHGGAMKVTRVLRLCFREVKPNSRWDWSMIGHSGA